MDKDKNIIEDLERRIYDLKNLINLGLSLSSNLDFESLVESVLYTCIGKVLVEKIVVMLQDDIDALELSVHMTEGFDREIPNNEVILHINSPLLKYLNKYPKALLIDEVEDEDIKKDLASMASLEPEMLIPMKSKNTLNGLIIMSKKLTGKKYSKAEQEFLINMAKFAAIAVENSRLYQLAILDRMTRLYVHHYFEERLIEEINRSKRENTTLSLIMADIDLFKSVNDTYGHQQGDIVLKHIALVIKGNIRSIDIPARYGGEEFAIILPSTDLEQGLIVSQRLREEVERLEVPGMDSSKVTISIGIAQYEEKTDKDYGDLIKRADTALYRAKREGRNKVVAHTD